jgi:hypothetical protein
MKKIFTLIAIAVSFCANSQTPVNLNIYHKLDNVGFAFNQAATNNTTNGNFKLNRLEYYMTKFTIVHDGGMTTVVPDNVVALVRANEQTAIALGNFNVTNIEGIKFHIGVHTPINHDDPGLQPSGSPLAYQMPSMQWGWTSGYRFVALEGLSGSAMNQTLELHGLGDINYLETTVSVLGSLNNGAFEININADYTRALENINLSSGLVVHGEAQQAATMLQNFNDYVFSSSNSLAGVDEMINTDISIYPIPSNGKITIETPVSFKGNSMKIYNQNGQLINTYSLHTGKNKTEIEIDISGVLILEFHDDKQKLFSKTILNK